MDPATQGLLGAAVVSTFQKNGYKHKLWLAGMLAGMAADLDVLIGSPSNPMLFALYHRHFTHALIFIPVGGALVALALMLFKIFREQKLATWLACTLGYATHGLLDCMTNYGTLYFWPFSNTRVAWSVISIMDPIFTGILLIGFLFSVIYEKPKYARVALISCIVYLSFGAIQHFRAKAIQTQLAKHRGALIISGSIRPQLFNLFLWQSYYIANNKVYVDTIYTPLFKKAYGRIGFNLPWAKPKIILPKINHNKISKSDYKIFYWFTHHYLVILKQKPLLLGDARYVITTLNPNLFLWGIQFPKKPNTHVAWLRTLPYKPINRPTLSRTSDE